MALLDRQVSCLNQKVENLTAEVQNLQQLVSDVGNECKRKDERIEKLENEVFRMNGRNLFRN